MPEMTIRDALREALREELLADPKVFLMGEDIGAYGGSYGVTKGLLEEFGDERIRDTPISELGIVGAGIGAAMAGLRPIVEIMTINFSFLAIDQIINNASKLHYMSGGQINVPVVIRMASGGGSQLGAQHSHSLEGWYAHVPGLKVVCPSNPHDAKGLLKTAFRDDNPVIFIEHTAIYGLKARCPDERVLRALRPGERPPRRRRRDHRRLLRQRPSGACAPRRCSRRPGGNRGRGHRPAHAAPAGHRHRHRLREEDQPRRDRRGRLALRRFRRRDRAPRSRSRRSTTSTRRSRASPGPTCRCPTHRALELRPCHRSTRSRNGPGMM